MLWFAGLALIAGFAYLIHKDKHGGVSVFLIGNAILALLVLGQIGYYALLWLFG